MNFVWNHRDGITTAVSGAIATASVALVSLYLAKRKLQATRRASISCFCGKVKVEVHQPAANYKYIEPMNLMCGCNDCMGYCQAVLKAGTTDVEFQKTYFDPGVPTILFYDSELSVVKGKEHLSHMKLSKGTENRRVFASCCGSPLAIAPDHSHLNLVYCNIVNPTPAQECRGEDQVSFPSSIIQQPTALLFARRLGDAAQDPSVREKHPNMTIASLHFAPGTILRCIGRLVLLLGMGARGPGHGFPVEDGKKVGIGYESIPVLMRNNAQ